MIIGILTFFNNANFGANLQALSTYKYLLKKGHRPVFINYKSKKNIERWKSNLTQVQFKCHIDFVKESIPDQTEFCSSSDELLEIIKKYKIESIIVGSDAVLQHHPLISRIKRGKRKPFFVFHYYDEMLFPNLLWGCGYAHLIPSAMMSVSSQNSEFKYFSPLVRKKMKNSVNKFKYISVRDQWTKDMLSSITGRMFNITPDPVFAFNQNASEYIPCFNELVNKFNVPQNYVLVSLRGQTLPIAVLDELKTIFSKKGLACIALTMPEGIMFEHHFDYEITPPLCPSHWYALIKYSKGYIGSNMHPIVVSLSNAVPCVSIDNWGRTDFFNRKIDDGSSKVEDIMKVFGVESNHFMVSDGICKLSAEQIVSCIERFPVTSVMEKSSQMYNLYVEMMSDVLTNLKK